MPNVAFYVTYDSLALSNEQSYYGLSTFLYCLGLKALIIQTVSFIKLLLWQPLAKRTSMDSAFGILQNTPAA